MMDGEIINDIKINTYFAPRIIDSTVLNPLPEMKYEPRSLCNKYVIKLDTRKNHWIMKHY